MMSDFDKLERDWDDISSEKWRSYHYSDGTKQTIEEPHWLHVSDSGGHRILDRNKISHYVKGGWQRISWKGEPAFVK